MHKNLKAKDVYIIGNREVYNQYENMSESREHVHLYCFFCCYNWFFLLKYINDKEPHFDTCSHALRIMSRYLFWSKCCGGSVYISLIIDLIFFSNQTIKKEKLTLHLSPFPQQIDKWYIMIWLDVYKGWNSFNLRGRIVLSNSGILIHVVNICKVVIPHSLKMKGENLRSSKKVNQKTKHNRE